MHFPSMWNRWERNRRQNNERKKKLITFSVFFSFYILFRNTNFVNWMKALRPFNRWMCAHCHCIIIIILPRNDEASIQWTNTFKIHDNHLSFEFRIFYFSSNDISAQSKRENEMKSISLHKQKVLNHLSFCRCVPLHFRY